MSWDRKDNGIYIHKYTDRTGLACLGTKKTIGITMSTQDLPCVSQGRLDNWTILKCVRAEKIYQ